MTQQWISALSFGSFSPPVTANGKPPTTDPRKDVQDIAMHWQSHSGKGSAAGMTSVALLRRAGITGYGPLINRVVEIHGLAGSIGEQLTLAWASEQDAQRWRSPDVEQDPQHAQSVEYAQRMAVRALCEMSSHFLLGTAHSLANLVLRVLLCNPAAAAIINSDKKVKSAQGFPPGSVRKGAWQTFSPIGELWSKTLPQAAEQCGLEPLEALAEHLVALQNDRRFAALDERRGMDYHRHRPQSLDQASPAEGTWSYDESTKTSRVELTGVRPDPRSDEIAVHDVCVDALVCIADAVCTAEPLIEAALAACHLAWLPTNASLL
ncbi:hypothetical protein [Streptomyces cathayae]|uniref:Uncharacterized protein n=1 Tax=Streptomyces cathayae TaxID=3031124 RepID=A0ABY8KC29_9ACTN|nr:hypothetical protein [Streptomyces sp. HUAS 5]WGD45159.1 hypothetical protein PYS65_34260 [Streptomyces sp. HUAS 5]